jgi:Ca2+-binding RTX toxin-like protein
VEDQVGDVLNLDVSALAPPVLVATLGASPSLPGVAQSIAAPPSHRPLNFVEIEDINLVDEGILTDVEMGDLYVRGSDAVDNVSFLAQSNPNVARVRVNAFQGYFTITRRAVVYGRGGNDYVQMGNFNHPAEFYGEEGDDYLTGYLADDKLVGGMGRDRINSSGGANVVWGDRDPVEVGLPDTEANRQLLASSLPGSAFHPLTENLHADILSALDGNDVMYGGPGIDQLTLGGGNDYAHGGQGNDSIALGLGDDRGYGGDGNDTITGSGGNDAIDGGEGSDSVSGDGGHDVLIGGGGNDTVNGGDGNDALFDGRVTYSGASTASNAAGDAADLALAALLADWAADFAVNNPFTDDHDGNDQLRGNAGADAFSAGALAEILDFQLGLDTLL